MAKRGTTAAPAVKPGATAMAYSPAPDQAPASVATGSPAGNPANGVQDVDMDHPVVHRTHGSAAPFQP